jgi:hypothetical protein
MTNIPLVVDQPVSGILVHNVPLTSPMSINQLDLIQVQLENRALLDNLAISPIGDL